MYARLLVVSLVATAIAACSSASAPVEVMGFKAGPLVTTQSATGALSLDVRTSPQPPIQGIEEAQLVITDATGKPVDGLRISVVPWMPAMGHGTSLIPTVEAQGNGVYQVNQLSLFMGGEWELRLAIDGPVQDTANPEFDVP